jgi:lysophosphatidate acyltransferase
MSILDVFYKFLGGYAALIMSLYMLSYAVPKAATAARLLASYACFIICALYGVVASIVLRLVGNPGISQWATARAFKYTMAATTGVSFEIIDPKNILGTVRPAVFIGNHQTELDVLMLGCMFPKYCSITSKASLKKWPVLGWFMSLSDSIFIDRQNSKDAREAMRGASDQIKSRRQSVYIFPEGTRSYAKDPMLLPFKKGAFHLAVQAGVPVVPCVVANYSHIVWMKAFVFNSGTIPVKGEFYARIQLNLSSRTKQTSRSYGSNPNNWPDFGRRRRADTEHSRSHAARAD